MDVRARNTNISNPKHDGRFYAEVSIVSRSGRPHHAVVLVITSQRAARRGAVWT